jgi:peptide/nickel transport system permease protein
MRTPLATRLKAFLSWLTGLVAVLFAVTLFTFALSHLLPGDTARMMAGPRASEASVQALRTRQGLDQPLPRQYFNYVASLAQGDLGRSIVTQRPVFEELVEVVPATLELVLLALTLGVIGGGMFGIAAALRRGGVLDGIARACASLAVSAPSFWLALVLLLLFYGAWDVLPGDGRIDPALDAAPTRTGLYVIDALLAGRLALARDALAHLALPALTLAIPCGAGVLRLLRSSMIEVLNEDYIRTALANGLPRGRIIVGHALRNAVNPLITVIGLEFSSLIFGAVVVETVFSWPGVGAYVVNAIFALDLPVIMGFTVFAALLTVLVNAGVDLLYRWAQPQLRETHA